MKLVIQVAAEKIGKGGCVSDLPAAFSCCATAHNKQVLYQGNYSAIIHNAAIETCRGRLTQDPPAAFLVSVV